MKFGMRVAIGVFVTSLAGALFVIKDAGKMEIAELFLPLEWTRRTICVSGTLRGTVLF